jgi:hypothetical protein
LSPSMRSLLRAGWAGSIEPNREDSGLCRASKCQDVVECPRQSIDRDIRTLPNEAGGFDKPVYEEPTVVSSTVALFTFPPLSRPTTTRLVDVRIFSSCPATVPNSCCRSLFRWKSVSHCRLQSARHIGRLRRTKHTYACSQPPVVIGANGRRMTAILVPRRLDRRVQSRSVKAS